MPDLEPNLAPQKLGSHHTFPDEGSRRQHARLYPMNFLMPPPQDTSKYPSLRGGEFPFSNISATPIDHYGEIVEMEDLETNVEVADDIPLLEPAPRRVRFAEENICACCRFSLLKKDELKLLDEYAAHVETQHWTVPYVDKLKITKIQHNFESYWDHRGHRQTWFYKQVTKSRYLTYLLLDAIRSEKNIVDNEDFTKKALDVKHSGPSDLQVARGKGKTRRDETRVSTSTRETAGKDGERRLSIRGKPSIVISAPVTAEGIESEGSEKSVEGAQVSYSVVAGKPSLHRLGKQEISSGEESDGERKLSSTFKRQSYPSAAPSSIKNSEAAEPPSIRLFAPSSSDSTPRDDSPVRSVPPPAVEFPEITITAPTESDPVVLFDPTQEASDRVAGHSPINRRRNSLSGSSLGDPEIKTIGKQSRTDSHIVHTKRDWDETTFLPKAEESSTDLAQQNGKVFIASTKTSTLPGSSTRRPPPRSPAANEGPSKKKPIWIVIGWFPTEVSEPIETCVIVEDPGHFLPDLAKHITGLRGWRSILSFKSVQGFGLYKCRPQQLGHISHHTNELENLALSQFFQACAQTYRRAHYKPNQGDSEDRDDDRAFIRRRDSMLWAAWVHKNMNNSRSCPFRSQLSLKLVLRWSTTRISIASAIPLVLAFAVGFWYSEAHDDSQTAWTIATFIVTAGAFIIAILAALTNLKDGQATPYPKVRISDDVV